MIDEKLIQKELEKASSTLKKYEDKYLVGNLDDVQKVFVEKRIEFYSTAVVQFRNQLLKPALVTDGLEQTAGN